MGKTAASSGTKTSPTPATVVLAGALGCFAAGYSARSLASTTKTIQKAVKHKLPTAIKNLLLTFTATSPKLNASSASAMHEAKPAVSPPSVQAAVVTAKPVDAAVAEPEQCQTSQPKHKSDHEKKRATQDESEALTTRKGPPEADVTSACSTPIACPTPEGETGDTKDMAETRTSNTTE